MKGIIEILELDLSEPNRASLKELLEASVLPEFFLPSILLLLRIDADVLAEIASTNLADFVLEDFRLERLVEPAYVFHFLLLAERVVCELVEGLVPCGGAGLLVVPLFD